MNKKILIFFLLFNCICAFAQKKSFNKNYAFLQTDTVIKSCSVFDFFRQELDSNVYTVGSVFLMPPDSLYFNKKNEYIIKVSNPKNGHLKIYFKNKLLYKYMLINNEIKGTGFCYYPFSGNVALQGRFKKGKLNGLVFVQNENGEMIEVMKFKKGQYLKHIYHWLSFSKKSLRARSKKRSSNPLRNDEIITQ
ncbi:MAG: hypothetical protein R6V52_00925 [Bacteroidales bacterium]